MPRKKAAKLSNRLSKEEVRHLAELAKIELSAREEELFSQQLKEILAYFAKLKEVDVSTIPPTFHVVNLVNVFRDDEERLFPSSKIVEVAPKRKGSYIHAPKM